MNWVSFLYDFLLSFWGCSPSTRPLQVSSNEISWEPDFQVTHWTRAQRYRLRQEAQDSSSTLPQCQNAFMHPHGKAGWCEPSWNMLLAHRQWWCATPAKKLCEGRWWRGKQSSASEKTGKRCISSKCSVNLKLHILSHQPSLLPRVSKRRFIWNALLHA